MTDTTRTPRKSRRWLRRWVWALPLAALAAWAWQAYTAKPPQAPAPTAAVETMDIDQEVQAAGTLQPRVKVDVGAQVSGQVRTVHVLLGQHVNKGDLLVSLDPELARNAVLQAEAALAQQDAALESQRVDLAQARRELERQRRMLTGDATSHAEAEAAEVSVTRLEINQRAQKAQVDRLRADLDKARLGLGYTQIIAPTDGDVVNIAVQEGQTVNAQQVTPVLLTLAKLDTITCVAQVAEADVLKIHAGQEASFVTLGNAEQRYRGQVRLVQPLPKLINNAQFYPVLFDVPNPNRTLMSDMTVQVNLRVAQARKVLAIPMVALGEKDKEGRYTVRVQQADGSEATRSVRVGINDAAKVQVLEGLKAGERVLTVPAPPASGASATH